MTDPAFGKIVIHPEPEVADLVPSFLQARREELTELRGALDRLDFGAISVIAHRTAGLAGGYGFDGMTEIARELEHAVEKKNAVKARHCVNMLAAYLDQVVVAD